MSGDQIPTLPGRKRHQCPGYTWGGGCSSFDLTGTLGNLGWLDSLKRAFFVALVMVRKQIESYPREVGLTLPGAHFLKAEINISGLL